MGLILEGTVIGATAGVVSGSAYGGVRFKIIPPYKLGIGVRPSVLSKHLATGALAGTVTAGAISLSPYCQDPDEIEL